MNPFTCIYCLQQKPEQDFNTEHVIPAGLGTFQQNHTLANHLVCATCNSYYNNMLENPELHDGYLAVLRVVHGIKQSEPHTNYQNIDIVAQSGDRKGLPAKPMFEKGVTVCPLTCAGFRDKTSKEYQWFRSADLPARDVVSHQFDLDQIVIYGEGKSELDDIHAKILSKYAGLGLVEKEWPVDDPTVSKAPMLVTTRITDRTLRLVAKIVFNYFVFNCRDSVFIIDSRFNAIRSFILNGMGAPNDFIRNYQGKMVENERSVPRGQLKGHILTISSEFWDGQTALVGKIALFNDIRFKVKLFVSPIETMFRYGHFYDLQKRQIYLLPVVSKIFNIQLIQ